MAPTLTSLPGTVGSLTSGLTSLTNSVKPLTDIAGSLTSLPGNITSLGVSGLPSAWGGRLGPRDVLGASATALQSWLEEGTLHRKPPVTHANMPLPHNVCALPAARREPSACPCTCCAPFRLPAVTLL